MSGVEAFERMSTASMVMKKAKKKVAVYSAKARAASKASLTSLILDMEKESSANQRPTILITHTAWPVRHMGRKITMSWVAQVLRRCAILLAGVFGREVWARGVLDSVPSPS